jgi:hypothetical protein
MNRWFVARGSTGRTVSLPLLLVFALLGLAAAATPAAADTATTLTISAQRTVVDWNSTAILNGILKTSANPPQVLDRQHLTVEYAPAQSGDWRIAQIVTNSASPYSSGEYTCSWKATRSYYWCMSYPGVPGQWAPAVSPVLKVGVRPLVGKPSCRSSVGVGQSFKASGSLKPRFSAGSKTVTLRLYRLVNRKWKAYGAYLATNAKAKTYSSYSVRIAIGEKGTYRLRAVTKSSSAYAAAKSAWSRTFRIQ